MTNDDMRSRISHIRATVDLPTLLLSYGVHLQKTGSGYAAKCIHHDDNNPSMSVYAADDHMRCFCHSCGFSEDVVGAYMQLSGDDFKEAIDALDGGERKHNGKPFATIKDEPPIKKIERIVTVPPADTPPPIWKRANYRNENDEWVTLGEPVKVWAYRTNDGAIWYYEARYERTDENGEVKKEPRCWTWGQRGVQPPRWEIGFPPAPRPLYGLQELPAAVQVLVCEGPKKAEAARKMLNGTSSVACCAWPGGANGVSRADWSALQGKEVIISPDADDTGRKAADAVAAKLEGIASKVWILRTDDLPAKWDVADAADEGWDKAKFIAHIRERKVEWSKPTEHEPQPEPEHEPIPELDDMPDMPEEEPHHQDYSNIEWGKPIDLFSDLLAPRIQSDQLPEHLSDWIFDQAEVIGVDPTMLALPAIVACASMIHDDIKLQPEEHNHQWKESARLWTAIVGSPSSKKSPAISRVLGIVKKIDAECNVTEGKIKYAYGLKEKAHATAEAAYVKSLNDGKEIEMPIKPEMPEIHRAIVQDFTIESLRDTLRYTARGVLAEKDELTGLFGSFDQYKSGGKGGSDRANWLELYNGGSRRIDRVGGGVFVKNWSCCVIGGIQPEPMRKIASGLQEDGMLQRFMIVFGRPGNEGEERPHDRQSDESYRAMIRQLWDTAPDGSVITLTPEANAIRKVITRRAYELIGHNFISGSMCAMLGKWEGLCVRLMLTYHAIECAYKHIHPQAVPVSAANAERVKNLMFNLLLPHAVQFYFSIGGGEVDKQLQLIGDLILAKHPESITLRDIMRGWAGWRNMAEYQQVAVISRLVEAGWLYPAPEARATKRYGLVSRYIVNPSLTEIYADRAERERERRAVVSEIMLSMKNND